VHEVYNNLTKKGLATIKHKHNCELKKKENTQYAGKQNSAHT